MTEIESLRQRRELVMLAAELQRATIVRRLERIETNPARRMLGLAASAASKPAVLRIGTALVGLAVRTYKKHLARRHLPRSGH